MNTGDDDRTRAGRMPGPPGRWASLFSGGKDSSWALYRALGRDLNVARLVTVHPEEDSYMYHVPATRLARLAAESIGIQLLEIEPAAVDGSRFDLDSGEHGDAEIEPLEAALSDLDGELSRGLAGVTAGAVESEFQTSRIEAMCERLGIDLFAPLWQASPQATIERMLAAGFEITIVQVAADGLDESWLGRTLDGRAVSELQQLGNSRGVHLLGEGGEYETLVTDGPHMERPIELTYEQRWDGMAGHLEIEDAWLG